MNKTLSFLFDLALVLVLVWLVFLLFKKEEPRPWKNPLQELPWKDLDEIQFLDKEFRVVRSKIKDRSFEIIKAKKSYPASIQRVQNVLDNFLFLPEFEVLKRSENAQSYGFKARPDLILQFRLRSIPIYLGQRHPVHTERFYFSFDADSFLLLPAILKEKFDFGSQDFLPSSPLSLKLKPEFLVDLKSKARGRFSGANFLKPKRFLAEGQSFELKPRLLESSINLKLCRPILKLGTDTLQDCGKDLVLPSSGIAWAQTTASRSWFREPEVQLFSKQLKDYFSGDPSKANGLKFTNGIVIKKGDLSFKFRLNKLLHKKGTVHKKGVGQEKGAKKGEYARFLEEKVQAFSLELLSESGGSYLSGGLNSKNDFILEPVLGFFFVCNLKGILPSR